MTEELAPDEMHLALRRHILTIIVETFKNDAGLSLSAGHIREIEGNLSYGEVTVVFRSAVNQISATTAISFDRQAALEASANIVKKPVLEIDDKVEQTLLDLSKRMCGMLALRLKEKRCIISIAPPISLLGRNKEIKELADAIPVRVPFRTAAQGWLVVDIAIEDI